MEWKQEGQKASTDLSPVAHVCHSAFMFSLYHRVGARLVILASAPENLGTL